MASNGHRTNSDLPEEGSAGFGDVEVPAGVSPEQFGDVLDRVSLPYKIAILLIVSGVLLMLLGLTGSVDFGISGSGFDVAVKRASPGLVLTILGTILSLLYKPNVRVKNG